MKVFLDTSILVYSLDPRDPAKRAKARGVLQAGGHRFVISTQVCQELFVTAVAKCGVAPLRAKQVLRSLTWAELVTVTAVHIEQAIDLHILHEVSFWDALIVAAAASAGCQVLWTGDLNTGQSIGGVRIENPLRVGGVSGR
jgi:predicted nucleic acid-binding protein